MKTKLVQISLLCLSLFVVSCGGGGDGGEEDNGGTGTFTVTVSSGQNGTTSISSVMVNANETTSFTLTANQFYKIDTVTGCGGSLVGNTYTTGSVIADCTVTASFSLVPITSFELIDPTPGANDRFGSSVVVLTNGNIVVVDPFDSTMVSNGGAVHLYDPVSQTLIASVYGDNVNDLLGNNGVTALANNNFVIASSQDDTGIIQDAGSVRLINGNTGMQIGTTLYGDVPGDRLGGSSITALANSNFVVASARDDEGGIRDAGSVRLIDGNTGLQIGPTLAGDVDFDELGSSGVTALANNNYVVASGADNEGGISIAGSVRLFDGNAGLQIGASLTGDVAGDRMGSHGTTALDNNNYVVASAFYDEGGITNAGSVRLFNGNTGVQIGASLTGDTTDDQLGRTSVTALANNNFVVASRLDNEGGISNAGSVRLINGNTGVQIGASLTGDSADDQLGGNGVIALPNNNYVVASANDDVGILANAGSVRIMNGNIGIQIGATLAGDMADDRFGLSVTALTNNNFVVASPYDDENGITNAGSVRLVDGSTGLQVGPTQAGDMANDYLGSDGVTALTNNNFVIASGGDDEGGITNAGSVRLVNGTTGIQIGNTLTGQAYADFLGITITPSAAPYDFYILAAPNANNNTLFDSGLVRLVAQ